MAYKIFIITIVLGLIALPLKAEQTKESRVEIPCANKDRINELLCERKFSPVCALIKTGRERFRRLTYSSKCLACSQTKVVSYTLGPCR